LEIPTGTQSGELLRMKRRGLPSGRSGVSGDQLVQVFVEVPKRLTDVQRDLLKTYAQTEETNVTPQRKSFFDKVKKYFTPSK